jgi:hypothetical protein
VTKRPMRREGGSALIVTVLLLILLGAIGLAALDTVTRDQQVAGYQSRSRLAFYAAEAAVADARDRIAQQVWSTDATVAFPAQAAAVKLGDVTIFPYGQPFYYGDPNAPAAIQYANKGAIDLGGGNDLREGREQRFNTLWRVRVVGATPDGATARIDEMTTKQLSGGNAY